MKTRNLRAYQAEMDKRLRGADVTRQDEEFEPSDMLSVGIRILVVLGGLTALYILGIIANHHYGN